MQTPNDGNEASSSPNGPKLQPNRPPMARDLAGQPRAEPEPPVPLPQTSQVPLTPDEIVASLNGRTDSTQKGLLERIKDKGGVLGALATIVITIVKFAAPALLLLGKIKVFALLAGSALLSIWLESKVFGWKLAAGIVALIFIHECGHALAARLRGIPTGIMVFIPFMGAFVTTKRYGRNLEDDAFIGIMGPIVGSVASGIAASFYLINHNPFWLELGRWGLFINLFNLLPTPPLDGGWIAPLFSPKLLAIGAILGVIAGFFNWFIWVLLIVSIPRILAGWRADPTSQPYYHVATAAKWKYGVVYFGLVAVLAIASNAVGSLMLA